MSLVSNEAAEQAKSAQGRTLISADSILILSVFLFGTMFQRVVDPRMERNIMFAGTVGIIAYLGLAYMARRRSAYLHRRSIERATSELEMRIDRHISDSASSAAATGGSLALNGSAAVPGNSFKPATNGELDVHAAVVRSDGNDVVESSLI